MPIQTSDNKYSVAKFIVNPTAGLGTHTTITAAMTSAVSGDVVFVTQGTYTENFTITPGVLLCAVPGAHENEHVKIVGKIIYVGGADTTISNIALQTNGDFCVQYSGTTAGSLTLDRCNILATDNTSVSFTNTSASSFFYWTDCEGNISTNTITLFAMTSAGIMFIDENRITNTGNSAVLSSVSDGALFVHFSDLEVGITSSGTSSLGISHTTLFPFGGSAVPLTVGGSGSNTIAFVQLFTQNAVAATINTTLLVIYSNFDTNAANVANGNGTITYGAIDITPFTGTFAGTLTLVKGDIYLGNIH